MIQDIAPHVFHNEYRPQVQAADESPVLLFDGRSILVSYDGANASKACDDADEVRFPQYSMLKRAGLSLIYAFAVDDTEYFLCPDSGIVQLDGFEYIDIRKVRHSMSNVYGMIAFTGFHLNQWYVDSVHCGRCGGRSVHAQSERAMHCPVCNRNIYPRIMPAVIVGVTDPENEKLLVTKYKGGFKYYALVAGFTEIGETLEETVAREVMEETGLRVKNIRYYKSQPWGIANDILVGFYCDVDGSSQVKIDEDELKLAEWKSPEEIELQPDSYSRTNEMMKRFKDRQM